MKKILVNFSALSYSLRLSQMRLNEQAKKHFDGVASFDETNDLIIDLFNRYPQISKYRRGAGYWFWKPYILLKTLENLKDGDFAFYIDSGTDIISDLTPCYKLCEQNNGFLIFENRAGNPHGKVWQNFMWTKRDCFVLMDCNTSTYHQGSQADGAYQLYQKNTKTINFLTEYFNYCTDPRIVTDEPNVTGDNHPQFIDHRHDQSVLSLLAIKNKIKLQPCPSECGVGLQPKDCTYGQLFWHHRGTVCGRK